MTHACLPRCRAPLAGPTPGSSTGLPCWRGRASLNSGVRVYQDPRGAWRRKGLLRHCSSVRRGIDCFRVSLRDHNHVFPTTGTPPTDPRTLLLQENGPGPRGSAAVLPVPDPRCLGLGSPPAWQDDPEAGRLPTGFSRVWLEYRQIMDFSFQEKPWGRRTSASHQLSGVCPRGSSLTEQRLRGHAALQPSLCSLTPSPVVRVPIRTWHLQAQTAQRAKEVAREPAD